MSLVLPRSRVHHFSVFISDLLPFFLDLSSPENCSYQPAQCRQSCCLCTRAPPCEKPASPGPAESVASLASGKLTHYAPLMHSPWRPRITDAQALSVLLMNQLSQYRAKHQGKNTENSSRSFLPLNTLQTWSTMQ